MQIENYRKTKDYIDAKKFVKLFCEDFLEGDINKLNGFDLESELKCKKGKKYIGDIKDPDMYKITQAIYILVWGYIYDLTYSHLGGWGRVKERQFPYRGDTMNSLNTVYGKDGFIVKDYFGANQTLIESVEEFEKIYHSIGNFIVIPNIGNVNLRRANYYSMQDYFDWFVAALYWYQHQEDEEEYEDLGRKLKDVFELNKMYSKDEGIDFYDWIRVFFLDSYMENERPKNVFEIDKIVRMKEHKGRKLRIKNGVCSEDEYKELAIKYYEKSKEIILWRGEMICEKILQELNT